MTLLIDTNLLVSAATIFVILCLSEVIRRFLTSVLPVTAKNAGFLAILLEFVGCFELLAVAYERGILMSTHGVLGSASPLFLVSLWRGHFWKNIMACPYVVLEAWIGGRVPGVLGCILVLVELAGGFLVFGYFSQYIWSFGLSDAHAAKFAAGATCSWAFKKHDLEAALYEALFSFAFGMTARFLGNVMPTSPLTPIIKASVFTYLVMAGGIMNPALAAVLQFRCSGITPLEHVVVYWVGPTVGGIGAYYVWKFLYTDRKVQPTVQKDKKKRKTK